jgi:hypothetical protein
MLFFFKSNAQKQVSVFGGVFTPKGDLKVLIVPVIFKDNPNSNPQFVNSAQWIEGWSSSNISFFGYSLLFNKSRCLSDNKSRLWWLENKRKHTQDTH